MNNLVLRLALAFIVLAYLATWAAPFLAPYPHKTQYRETFFAPPQRPRFFDREGRFHLRPFVYALERDPATRSYRETDERIPLALLVSGERYTWMGRSWNVHLFGAALPERRVFLLGTDDLGRDLLSRILYGAQFSLTIGLVGIVFTLAIGVGLGALAGYVGGRIDALLMRLADLFLSLPGLFLVLGIRAVFPREMSLRELYWLIVVIFSLIGWAGVARVIRGQVASLAERPYVLAARAAGASHGRILLRHVLPFTSNYLIVQGTLLIPAFILGEITLSFLGVGVQAPDSSWGVLLNDAISVHRLTTYPWLLTPALFIFLTVLAFNLVGDELKRRT